MNPEDEQRLLRDVKLAEERAERSHQLSLTIGVIAFVLLVLLLGSCHFIATPNNY